MWSNLCEMTSISPHAVVQIIDIEDRQKIDNRINFTIKVIQGRVKLNVAYHLYGPKQIRVILKPHFEASIDTKCITEDLACIKLCLPGQKAEIKDWVEGERHNIELLARKELLDLKPGDYLAMWGLKG